MSHRVVNWAYEQALESPTELFLLVTLADEANHAGEVWRGQDGLASRTKLGLRTVQRFLAKFEELGLIKKTFRHLPDGTRTSDLITLQVGQPATVAGSEMATTRQPRRDNPPMVAGSNNYRRTVSKNRKNIYTREVGEILGSVLDERHTQDVITHRNNLKKPLTALSASLLAKNLSKTRNPNEAAEEMIMRGWRGFKPEWVNGHAQEPPANDDDGGWYDVETGEPIG